MTLHIRDPIHGAVEIASAERRIIDTRSYQRLRHVKQLGFADLAFPGATHSRYSHGIGAMSVATRLFDAIYAQVQVAERERARLRQTLRLAALLHDLGHPPLSHTSERLLPPLASLHLPPGPDAEGGRASHEDMTLWLLLHGPLHDELRAAFAGEGIEPSHVAALLSRRDFGTDPFRVGGTDHAPLLRALVSGELDCDRMDYLLRDSLYTGVHYGNYDLDWLVQNVLPEEQGGALYLGLRQRAVFAFEDFLLSRYHMFLSVYYHHTSVNYEHLLGRWYEAAPGEYALEADAEKYVLADDVQLLSALRASADPWARRIVERRGFVLLAEVHPFEPDAPVAPLTAALSAEGIDHFVAESKGVVSKYFRAEDRREPLFVRSATRTVPIEEYTPLFRRYAEGARMVRVYVDPDCAGRARELAGPLARR